MSERPTDPPTVPDTEVPAAPAIPRSLEPRGSYDPDSWHDVTLQALLEAVRELKASRAAFDPEALIARAVTQATEHFTEIMGEKLTLVRDELRGLNEQFQLLSGKVQTLQDESEGAKNRMAGYERELAGIRAELAKLAARLTELEALRGKLQDDPAQAPTPPG